MESFLLFVQNWGYVAVFLGALVEGESVILTASFLASQGYLSLYKVMLIAFLGTLFADQGLYQVGYHYGPSFFDRFPQLRERASRAFDLLHKWDAWFIISCRFIYGIRIISPIVIGAAGVKPWRFIPLNFLSAAVWTIISCVGGYLLGDTVAYVIENFHAIEQYLILGVIGIIGLIALIIYFLKRRKKEEA